MFYSSDEIRFCSIQETRLGFVWLVSWTCLLAVHGWLYLTHSGLRRPRLEKLVLGELDHWLLPTCSTYLLNSTYLLTHSPRTNLKLVFLKKMAQIKTILLFNKSTSTSCAPGCLNQPAVNLKDFKCFIFSFGPFVKYISHVNWFWLRARHLMVGRRLHFFMQLFAFLQSSKFALLPRDEASVS